MLPSVLPRLATDSAASVSWCLETSLLDSPPGMELPPCLLCLFFHLLFFFLPVFEDNDLLFWVPDVLCQHSEGVLWNLFSVKCSFDEFVGEKVVSPSYSSAILGPPPGIILFRMIALLQQIVK